MCPWQRSSASAGLSMEWYNVAECWQACMLKSLSYPCYLGKFNGLWSCFLSYFMGVMIVLTSQGCSRGSSEWIHIPRTAPDTERLQCKCLPWLLQHTRKDLEISGPSLSQLFAIFHKPPSKFLHTQIAHGVRNGLDWDKEKWKKMV